MANFDETFDWVVVGCGGGSMASGLLMKSQGKSVVILEKTKFAGGTTCKSGGVIWMPNNQFMDPGEDSLEKGCDYLDNVVGDGPDRPGTSPEKRRAYIVEGNQMIDFLVRQGVALERGSWFWPDYYDELPGGCKTSRTITAKPFNKNELGEWAPRLRQAMLDLPIRLDDGMKVAFIKHKLSWLPILLKTGVKIVLGKLTGKHWVTAGGALQGRMLQASLKAGLDIRLETGVKEVVIENGKATGVVVEKDGKPWRIGANLGILVNAGGFGHNQEMRDKYMPGTRSEWSMVPEGDTGDMHIELERHGGVLAQMDQMVGFQMSRAPGWEQGYVAPGMQAVTARPHAILVDQSGERYMNEGGSYEAYCEGMLVRNRTVPAVPSWAILDSQFLARYPLADGGSGKAIPEAWRSSGWLKEGATVEELAGKLGIDPAVLKATVDRWNGFVDQGHDDDFLRGDREYDKYLGDPTREGHARSMGRIDKGPFYAVEVVPGDVSTYGGVITDANSRVMKADGTAIEGLYACGVTTASPMGLIYPGAGASVGPSMTFGWIAAKHAAGLGNQAV